MILCPPHPEIDRKPFVSFRLSIFLAFWLLLATGLESFAHKEMQLVSDFGGKGEVEGKFGENTRLTFDKDANIYIVDTDAPSIQKLDPSGKPILKIPASQEGSNYNLVKPFDIAISQKGEIFVSDWKFDYVKGTEDPKIYRFGICIHKFSPEGHFISSFMADDPSQKFKRKDEAAPGLDEEGNFILIVRSGKAYRPVYVTTDPQDDIYLLDEDSIYKFSSDGKLIKTFAQRGGGDGQLDNAVDIEADSEGDIYLADKGNNRIVKFRSDGEFIMSFGKKGEEDGDLLSPELIAAYSKSILVADRAKYRKFVDLPLPARENDPSIDRSLSRNEDEIEGQLSSIVPYRRSRIIIRRVQKFSSDGKFEDKFLIRIDLNDPQTRHLKLKAIDPKGNVYLIDEKRQIYKKYAPTSPLRLPKLQKLVSLGYQIARSQFDVDNPDDLDDVNRISDDYIQKEKVRGGFLRFEIAHDLDEDVRLSLSNWATYFKTKVTSLYPGEQRDYRGFPQDDISLDKYLADFVMLDANLILNHSAFKYREAGFFAYFGRVKYDFSVDAISRQNLRNLKMELWANQWGGGLRYDMGRTLRFILEISHGPALSFFNYDYIYHDESGILYATGFFQGKSTSAAFALDWLF